MAGGGPLWDMGCHKFDMLVDLFDLPESVFGITDTLTHSYEVEDSCSVLLKLKNGAHCISSFNWNSKVWADEFEILGTAGKIILDPCDSDRLLLRLAPHVIKGIGREDTCISRPNHINVHYPLIDDFVKAMIDNREPRVTGVEGYKTNRILSAVGESASTGKKISI